MQIKSAIFIKGITSDDANLHNGKPQVAIIGRSNAGKSTLINTLCENGNLAKSSKSPGRTREINLFLINNTHYFVDLPGYGYAKTSIDMAHKINDLINWYLFNSEQSYKAVVLIDSFVGPTEDDLKIIGDLEKTDKEVIIVLNKIDKVKKSHQFGRIKELTEQFPVHKVIACSSKEKTGVSELRDEILG